MVLADLKKLKEASERIAPPAVHQVEPIRLPLEGRRTALVHESGQYRGDASPVLFI
ncbi:hypothetical protein [Pseudomonas uvaldensis]|uniref:hypothetical protein n=1 Tax=Pseudomonas uvaldensis TaxID=2878385 RepID=UPI001E285EF6|nr:hypothetical protein [Pseudomonas uvaldensis]MCE0460138.1 hypothetical protein [Pseudomonas uvaldensis]